MIMLMKFGSSFCSPCRAVQPILSEMENLYNVKYFDVEEDAEIAENFSIRSLPTVLIFKDGGEVDRLVGSFTREKLDLAIKNCLR